MGHKYKVLEVGGGQYSMPSPYTSLEGLFFGDKSTTVMRSIQQFPASKARFLLRVPSNRCGLEKVYRTLPVRNTRVELEKTFIRCFISAPSAFLKSFIGMELCPHRSLPTTRCVQLFAHLFPLIGERGHSHDLVNLIGGF